MFRLFKILLVGARFHNFTGVYFAPGSHLHSLYSMSILSLFLFGNDINFALICLLISIEPPKIPGTTVCLGRPVTAQFKTRNNWNSWNNWKKFKERKIRL